MLTKDEIEAYKRFPDPYLAEKDYLQEIILHDIYSNRKSTRSFAFKGGTALSKFYSSDRFSEDLDFTLFGDDAPVDELEGILEEMAARLFYDTKFLKKPTTNEFFTVSAELGIEGPRYNKKPSSLQHISLEINTASKLLHEPLQLPRKPEYGDIDKYIGTVMDRKEILSEKFRAITGNGRNHRERDLYDINFLLDKGVVPDHAEIAKKFSESGRRFSKEALLKAISTIGPSWNDIAPFVGHRLEDYESAKTNVITKLKATGIL